MGCVILPIGMALFSFAAFVVMLIWGIIAARYGVPGASYGTACLATFAIDLVASMAIMATSSSSRLKDE